MGKPHRTITHYIVTVVPRDGGDSQAAFVLAEAGIVYNITGLNQTTYDVKVEQVIIDTEGQGEQIYDLGSPMVTVTTTQSEYVRMYVKNSIEGNARQKTEGAFGQKTTFRLFWPTSKIRNQ